MLKSRNKTPKGTRMGKAGRKKQYLKHVRNIERVLVKIIDTEKNGGTLSDIVIYPKEYQLFLELYFEMLKKSYGVKYAKSATFSMLEFQKNKINDSLVKGKFQTNIVNDEARKEKLIVCHKQLVQEVESYILEHYIFKKSKKSGFAFYSFNSVKNSNYVLLCEALYSLLLLQQKEPFFKSKLTYFKYNAKISKHNKKRLKMNKKLRMLT